MIAFFLTMPISSMMPIKAMTLRSAHADQQGEQRADAGRGQRRQDRDRMDVALVQDAEHDVDGTSAARISRGWLRATPEGLRRPLETAVYVAGMPISRFGCV